MILMFSLDKSLPETLANELMQLTCMLLLAHAFELAFPGKKNRSANKLVSTLDETSLSFPKEAREFLINTAMLSKHWETKEIAGNHNDSPSCKCKCYRLSGKEDAWMFWGISESRFLKQWKLEGMKLLASESASLKFQAYFLKSDSTTELDKAEVGNDDHSEICKQPSKRISQENLIEEPKNKQRLLTT
ncbi:hypothetical protein IE077_004588 [Cardiosporidium cionae]|uniref:Uncharacterized protein n=1 Tax=Cardiosporidium cionae TaxID=476202 RepID=A0ABQ7JEJ0_9APIC|nr:hypothetical protein IE077_004588 [Cardiosporidium cionae]|eukprot:KAF8822426.1 hypothetical protein IE077_004588 [Cardiosporidium cionae]